MRSLRLTLYEMLESGSSSPAAQATRTILTTLICLSVAASVIGTIPQVNAEHASLLKSIQQVSLAIFATEYLTRLWVCVEDGRSPIVGRLRFALSPMMLVDLAAIVPGFLPKGTVDLRTMRVFRLIRMLKISRHSRALRIVLKVLRAKYNELAATAFVAFLMLIASSSVVYFLENPAQPDVFSSIPATMWWGVATLSTMGYGDMVPSTPLGKIIGALVSVAGVGLFALPAGILSSGFVDELNASKEADSPRQEP